MQCQHFPPVPISAKLVSATTLKFGQRVAVERLKQIGVEGFGVAGGDCDLPVGRPALLLSKYL